MATNTRDIKDRIVSVEKTNKITQAMKMVSAAKFKRNLKALERVKAYGKGVDAIVDTLANRLYDDSLSPLLMPNSSPQVAVIVVSSDRGLCGGFNAQLFKKVSAVLAEHSQVDLYTLGNKAYQFFKSKDVNLVDYRPSFTIQSDHAEIADYVASFSNAYVQGVYSKVLVVFNEFVSALSANQVVRQILPISLPNWPPQTITASDFIYEPAKESVLTDLCRTILGYNVSLAIHESLASEEGFRMAAMDSASSNAKEMIGELTLFYNRSRQAAITTELTEIVAGAASIS